MKEQPDYYIEGGDGSIDEELIPLLNELNNIGLKTTQSCSGHGRAEGYISFSVKNINSVVFRKSKNNTGRFTIYWESKYSKTIKDKKYIIAR